VASSYSNVAMAFKGFSLPSIAAGKFYNCKDCPYQALKFLYRCTEGCHLWMTIASAAGIGSFYLSSA
jgi:hypothetical protein